MSDKQKTLSPFMERFLITILGTTLSIALTFGTTALVNSHKKKAAQKQTAMLVIHDINNTIESMEATKNQCEKDYESAQYFLEYMDCPEAAEPDRLAEAIDASLQLLIHLERENSINESTEKIFTGSLDAWNNLDNMRFVENVQYFYYTRRDWINMTNTSLSWRAPIEQAEIVKRIANFDYSKSYTQWDIWGEFLKGKMKDKTVRYFLDITPNRIREYSNMIQRLRDLNEENMFLMNITDEELERFVNEIEDNKSPLNERYLVGTWADSQNVSGNHIREDEFRSDHSFESRDTIVYTNWQFRGRIKVSVAMGGKWEIKKDSLIRYYDKETLRTAIDTSAVSASEDKKQVLSDYVQSMSDYYEKQLADELDDHPRSARKGSFNLTRSKLELTLTVTDENGEPQEQTSHYKRKK